MQHEAVHSISVRVYAFVIEHDSLLIAEEFHFDRPITKLPGGGLEPGEGTLDCLHREADEEFGQDVDILGHFHTTDFFQPIYTRPGYQLLGIYYVARLKQEARFVLNDTPFEHTLRVNGSVAFRWVPLTDLRAEDMTFATDKDAVARFIEAYRTKKLTQYGI